MKRDDTMESAGMKLLTKREACRELRVSLSTLNRRISAGEVAVKREPRGRRHRVYVMLDDDPPSDESGVESGNTELAVAQERICGPEEQVDWLQGQLELEQQRNAGLVKELSLARARRGLRWRFWQS